MNSWTYNGTDTLSVTFPCTAGHTYWLISEDPDSTGVNATAAGSSQTLTVSDIGGLSSGQQVLAFVYDATANVFVGVVIYAKDSTSSVTDPTTAWTYDGANSASATLPTTAAVIYDISFYNPTGTQVDGDSATGTGSSQTISLTSSAGGWTSIPGGEGVMFSIFDESTSSYVSARIGVKDSSTLTELDSFGGAPFVPDEGRVLIAFNDGPLVADPTWTRIDGATNGFPDQFVAGYDVHYGRQTLLSQTDTGTATVYINDHELALFDPRNVSSPYFGQLDGKQILLQLWDPVAAAWEDQFRGHIDDVTWDIDPATGSDGKPINASIQIDCVDIFDFLAGYGLTPGLDGVTPPAGGEDGVWYATTAGTNDDRLFAILTNVGVDPTRYHLASGNTHVLAVKYDPDESALQALRDGADADGPFLANIYCDRHGLFQFRGRYSRFYPDAIAAEPDSHWDFQRWAVGDGTAIMADSNRAQMRILSFGRLRSELINVAVCYPQDLVAADMPNQVFADATSITDFGQHAAPPMSDLLLDKDATQPVTGFTGKDECFYYAKLLVENQKSPRINVTALQLKSIGPDDPRAAKTWELITKADISHIVNVAVGYPAGTGLAGDSPTDDYYIEGRELRVRPLNPTHDYVELNLEVSPFEWSADTHGVFPDPPVIADGGGGPGSGTGVAAHFTSAPSGLMFTVTDASTAGPSGPITAWDLDWGDGTSHATGAGPWTHTYATDGDYTVTLTITGTSPDGTSASSQGVVAGTGGGGGGGTGTPPLTVGALILDDDFAGSVGDPPDSAKWNAKSFTAPSGTVFAGLSQIDLDGSGHLRIKLDFVGGQWKSGFLTSKHGYAGRRYMEVSALVSGGHGTWNSPIWEWNFPFGSAPGIENDIIEQLGGKEPTSYHTTLHNWNGSGDPQSGFTNNTGVTLSGGYHRYGAAVYSDRVDYYFDGTLIRTIHTSAVGLTSEFVTTPMSLNISMNSGGWAGSRTFTPPVYLLVDYVSVWALP